MNIKVLFFFIYSLSGHAENVPFQRADILNSSAVVLSKLCDQRGENCSDETRKAIEKINLTCELQVQGNECEKLAKEHPELEPLMRRCDVENLCHQNEEFLKEQRSACLRGFKNAAIDLGTTIKDQAISLADFVDTNWEKLKIDVRREILLRQCDKSLACKRLLVREDALYSKLSDEKLSQMPAKFLYEREKNVQEVLAERERKAKEELNSPGPREDIDLDVEKTEKLKRLIAVVDEQIQDQYHRFQCYHPLAQQEMRCYAVGSFVDPMALAGYFLKVARAGVAISRLSRIEQVKGKAEDIEEKVGDVKDVASAIVENERRLSLKEKPFKGPEQRQSLAEKKALDIDKKEVEVAAVSKLPKSIRIYESTNIEGKKQLKYEYAVRSSSFGWVRASKEFQIDELTGAINANYPNGRKLFEKVMQEKAGEAHFAFIDVGSLGAVNKTFAAGKEAGDRYIKAVAESIMKKGEGKITLARLGGDEFGLIIDEKNPEKVQKILEAIQKDVRENVKGDAHLVFREEKIARVQAYRNEPADSRDRNLIDGEGGIAKLRQDLSIGSSEVGSKDNLENVLNRAEEQAKEMKIPTTLALGRSAKKYGSKAEPRARPQPRFLAPVQSPASSPSWKKPKRTSRNSFDDLPEMKFKSAKEIKRFKNDTLVAKVDESGETSYFLERYSTDAKTGERVPVSYEIPTRGQTGMLDGLHPASKELIVDHFSANADNVLVMPKLESLRLLNYFENGTKAGDEALVIVSKIIQKNMRQNDLSFKLNGADFLWSLEKVGDKELRQLTTRITEEMRSSPQLKKIIDRERKSLESKIRVARKANDQETVQESQSRLKELENFDPELNFQFLKREEVSDKANFDELEKTLDNKFTQSRSASDR